MVHVAKDSLILILTASMTSKGGSLKHTVIYLLFEGYCIFHQSQCASQKDMKISKLHIVPIWSQVV
jgi:hypothetical protein